MERRDEQPELGTYVRKLRTAAGLSVRGLARAAGVDATGISRLENGENEAPEPRTLAALARALGVDVADFYVLAGYEAASELPAFQPYLRAKYDMTPEEIEQLAAYFQLIRERQLRQKGGRDDDTRRTTAA